ncbi:hypothetical protein, partial [Pseudomonas sp.]|uniref:hypothetical protein n=1 Tax=Pseudomonas sp. TaxID=306 RepID=UPI0027355709
MLKEIPATLAKRRVNRKYERSESSFHTDAPDKKTGPTPEDVDRRGTIGSVASISAPAVEPQAGQLLRSCSRSAARRLNGVENDLGMLIY